MTREARRPVRPRSVAFSRWCSSPDADLDPTRRPGTSRSRTARSRRRRSRRLECRAGTRGSTSSSHRPNPARSAPVTRSSGTRNDLLAALVAGPTEDELSLPLSSALPAELEVLSTRSVGSVLYVDLSSAIAELSGSGLTLAVAQIVFTATDIEGVDAVQLTVDGQRFPWPRPDGATTTGPAADLRLPGLRRESAPSGSTAAQPGPGVRLRRRRSLRHR